MSLFKGVVSNCMLFTKYCRENKGTQTFFFYSFHICREMFSHGGLHQYLQNLEHRFCKAKFTWRTSITMEPRCSQWRWKHPAASGPDAQVMSGTWAELKARRVMAQDTAAFLQLLHHCPSSFSESSNGNNWYSAYTISSQGFGESCCDSHTCEGKNDHSCC